MEPFTLTVNIYGLVNKSTGRRDEYNAYKESYFNSEVIKAKFDQKGEEKEFDFDLFARHGDEF